MKAEFQNTKKVKVLISNPSMIGHLFIPYFYSLVRQNCSFRPWSEQIEWLFPITTDDFDKIDFSNYQDIDFLFLSNYVWNEKINLKIAQKIKQLNSSTIIIAGGPQPNWNDSSLFKNDYAHVDAVCMKEGENVIANVLELYLRNENPLNQMGLILNQNGVAYKTDGAIEKNALLHNQGPYSWDFEFHKLFLQNLNTNEALYATLETNRGCPYLCQFCDWGSDTFSKIRNFKLERVLSDIDALVNLKVTQIFITDANFGIQQRDLEVARYIAKKKMESGYPKKVIWSNAKNNSDRVIEITKLFAELNLARSSLINYQTTFLPALDIMKRASREGEHFAKITTGSQKLGIPTTAVTIVGSPGETIQGALNTIIDVVNNNHDSLRWNPYLLLNNAPANSPDYLEKYGIKFLNRPLLATKIRKKDLQKDTYPNVNFIVAHNKMSSDEWKQIMFYNALFSGMYFSGIYRLTFDYLKNFVPLKTLTNHLINSFTSGPTQYIYELIQYQLEQFIQKKESYLFEVENSDLLLDLDQYITFQLIAKPDLLNNFSIKFLSTLKSHNPIYDYNTETLTELQWLHLIKINDDRPHQTYNFRSWKSLNKHLLIPESTDNLVAHFYCEPKKNFRSLELYIENIILPLVFRDSEICKDLHFQ